MASRVLLLQGEVALDLISKWDDERMLGDDYECLTFLRVLNLD